MVLISTWSTGGTSPIAAAHCVIFIAYIVVKCHMQLTLLVLRPHHSDKHKVDDIIADVLALFVVKGFSWPQLHMTKPELHDDVITWKRFRRYWPFVRGIHHRSSVDSTHKGPVTRALVFSLMLACTTVCTNSRAADDLRRHGAHCDVA